MIRWALLTLAAALIVAFLAATTFVMFGSWLNDLIR